MQYTSHEINECIAIIIIIRIDLQLSGYYMGFIFISVLLHNIFIENMTYLLKL